jgi:hypothetical protein
MPARSSKAVTAFILLIALIAWLATGLQLYILIKNAPSNGLTVLQATGRFFGFFTILTNLLVAISLSCILLRPASHLGRFFSKASTLSAIALYIFIVGLVYNTILRFIWSPLALQKWVDESLHVIIPVLFILYWLWSVPKGSLKWADPFRWLAYPAIYLLYALARGALSGFYAYPFINVTELGYNRVLLNAVGLMLVFVLTGFLFVAIDSKLSSSRNKVFS